MAKFLKEHNLNSELAHIFENAKEQIIIISPYIKLHERYISILKRKKEEPAINITIVFGKNEENLSRSMKKEDFNFFKDFPNIEIRYEKRLHAKYYANEFDAILTSMNLYDYSQDVNIETGVMMKASFFKDIAKNLITNVTGEDSLDKQSSDYFNNIVIKQAKLLFKNVPVYEKGMLGFSKKYKSSKTECDELTNFFENLQNNESNRKKDTNERKTSYIQVERENNIVKEPEIREVVNSMEEKYFSTTALSKEIGIPSKDLFYKFEKLNLIERKNDDWILTDLGINKGAQIKRGQYGNYISWPESIVREIK